MSNDEDPVATATAAVPPTADQVSALLEAERQKYDLQAKEQIQAAIAERDAEWNEHIATQYPDPEPATPAPIDTNKLKSEATTEALDMFTKIDQTKSLVIEEAQKLYGAEGLEIARKALANANPQVLADPANAAVISALVGRELFLQGKMPTTGPNASNNGVESKPQISGMDVFESVFGGPPTEADLAEAGVIR